MIGVERLRVRVPAITERYGLAKQVRDERAAEVAFLYEVPVPEVLRTGFSWAFKRYPADPRAAEAWNGAEK